MSNELYNLHYDLWISVALYIAILVEFGLSVNVTVEIRHPSRSY